MFISTCRLFLIIFTVSSLSIISSSSTCADEKADKKASSDDKNCPVDGPCITDPPEKKASDDEGPCITDPDKGEGTPDPAGTTPGADRPRRMWANSFLWAKAPKLEVERWTGNAPKTDGKYVLIEVWATWCGPCRRSIPILNAWQKKYKDELVVIGICETDEKAIEKMEGAKPQFYSAIDTKKRMKTALGVWGIPHLILIEPNGYVVWEGFPLQPGYELKDSTIDKMLEIGRKLRAKGTIKLPEKEDKKSGD